MSDKHGPRLDDELAREAGPVTRGAPLDPHTEEFKEKVEDAGGPAEDDAVALRREVSRFLDASTFPASAKELEANAGENGASDEALALLRSLPAAPVFATAFEAWRAIEAATGTEAHDPYRDFERHAEGREPPARQEH